MERVEAIFAGRVQGVGFRVTARACSRGVPVTGWVRNEPDGSVRLQVQGLPEHVGEYLRSLREKMGRGIASENLSSIPVHEGERGFEIAR